jgi:hypothetical protein
MEAGVTVVQVGGGGLTNYDGAQHHGGRVTHFEVAKRVFGVRWRWVFILRTSRNVVQRRVVMRWDWMVGELLWVE